MILLEEATREQFMYELCVRYPHHIFAGIPRSQRPDEENFEVARLGDYIIKRGLLKVLEEHEEYEKKGVFECADDIREGE